MNLKRQFIATMLLLCMVTFTYAQGESCATAVAITPGVISADGPSTGGMPSQDNAVNADWYTFTPASPGLLSIDACGGGADTRLWIWEGTCADLLPVAENDDFCDLGNGQGFASAVENVLLEAGVTYYIEWDDRWFEFDDETLSHPAFDFNLAFVAALPNDVAVVADKIPFFQIPESQVPTLDIPLVATVTNIGTSTATNVVVTVDITDESGANVFSNTPAPITSLPSFESMDVLTASWSGPVGSYEICFTSSIDGDDDNPLNNTFCRPLRISDATYAIDDPNGTIAGLGVPDAGATINQGQTFLINNDDEMTSISAFLGGGSAGDTIQYQVYELNPNNTVGNILYDSGVTTLVAAEQGWTNHVMSTPLAVTANTSYVVSVFHRVRTANIALGTSSGIFIPQNAWVNLNQDGWGNAELFNVEIAYQLRPIFGVPSVVCDGPNNLICETLDNYDPTQPLGPQSPIWTTWSGAEGAGEDGLLSTEQAASGANAVNFVGGGNQDVLLLLGNRTTGRYRTTFDLFIPTGNAAFYNIQHFEVPGMEWAHQVTFNTDGTGDLDAEQNDAATFNYTQNAWITVDQIIDIDNDWTTLIIDGVQVHSWPFSAQANAPTGTNQLGAFNFFPIDGDHNFFVDNVFLELLPPCNLDFETVICDDFEFYADGSFLGPQSSFWTTWSGAEGTSEDALASTDFAASGTTSMLIAEGSSQDVILDLGNIKSGRYELEWLMYIPAGANGYYNLQGTQTPGEFFEIENVLGQNGAGSVNNQDLVGATYTYPHDAWFEVSHIIDLDNNVMELSVNGNVVEAAWPYENNLGGVDFFSIDATNRYYVDNLTLKQLDPAEPTSSVTFLVDMNAVITAGILSPNGVHIMGDFNSFNPAASEMTDADGDGIYEFTANGIETGSTVEFRYVNGNSLGADEDAITADCGVDAGGTGVFNRVWDVQTTNETTTPWCFNECLEGVCSPIDVSVDEIAFESGLSVYPNPTSGNTAIYYNFPEALDLNIRITNSIGQVIYDNNISNAVTGTVDVEVNHLVPGVYFVLLSDGENLISKKLFVER